MVNALLCNNSRNLWSEVNKLKGMNSTVTSAIYGNNDSDSFVCMFPININHYNSQSLVTLMK